MSILTGFKPAVGCEFFLGFFGLHPIFLEDVWAANLQVSALKQRQMRSDKGKYHNLSNENYMHGYGADPIRVKQDRIYRKRL